MIVIPLGTTFLVLYCGLHTCFAKSQLASKTVRQMLKDHRSGVPSKSSIAGQVMALHCALEAVPSLSINTASSFTISPSAFSLDSFPLIIPRPSYTLLPSTSSLHLPLSNSCCPILSVSHFGNSIPHPPVKMNFIHPLHHFVQKRGRSENEEYGDEDIAQTDDPVGLLPNYNVATDDPEECVR